MRTDLKLQLPREIPVLRPLLTACHSTCTSGHAQAWSWSHMALGSQSVIVWSQIAVIELSEGDEHGLAGTDVPTETLTLLEEGSASGTFLALIQILFSFITDGDDNVDYAASGEVLIDFDDLKSLKNFTFYLHHKLSQPLSVTGIINLTESIVGKSEWRSLKPDIKHTVATKLLHTVASTTMAAALNAPEGRVTASTESLELEVRVHRGDVSENERLTLNVRDNAMELYWGTVTGGTQSGAAAATAVAFIAYGNLATILDGDFADGENGKLEKMGRDYRLNSDVVTIAAGAGHEVELSEPVNFTLRHLEERSSNKIPLCVYWEHTNERSFWSPRGCKVIISSGSQTTCGCVHLASFAVLTAPYKMQVDLALHIITLIGVSVSLACLAISIVTFAFCRSIQRETRTIHANLCLSLFLAQLLFVTGISRTSDKVVCAVIAGLLHYFFLAAFAWMFLEGLHLFLMVRDLRQVKGSRSTTSTAAHLYMLGYALPAVVVAISAAVNPSGFGTLQHCWLQLERGFIWSFMGPVSFIILVNTALLTSILWILRKQLSSLNSKVSKVKDTRMLTFKAIAQVFVLGCTWILGLFHFGEGTIVMAYLFTIVNSFQGTFIFIILCVLNEQVRKEYRRCFGRMTKTTLSTESTSMGMLPSRLGESSVMELKT
uniref:adhesion G protein-coupled receptor E1-like n=1 Tax=Pristiophorus japonicus TaxID=55135 RepID=UPI00398F3CB3